MPPETAVEDSIALWFRDHVGNDNVSTQVYQPPVDWFCDIVVQTAWCRLYIEVENDADSIRAGIAQAQAYAADDPVGVPMVIGPVNDLGSERAERLRRSTPALVRSFDSDDGFA